MRVLVALGGIALLASAMVSTTAQTQTEKRTPPEGNSLCLVCHLDLSEEVLATTHLAAGVTCASCHGPSTGHMHDEMLMTKPDVLFGRSEVQDLCLTCHPPQPPSMQVHAGPPAVAKFFEEWFGKSRPNGRVITDAAICTDCHGTHNIVKQMGGGDETEASEWFPLFNRNDLDGWRAEGPARWSVEKGRLRVDLGERGAASTLWTDAVYEDFLLTATFKCAGPVLGGLWLRHREGKPGPRVGIFDGAGLQHATGSVQIPGRGMALPNLRPELVSKETWNTLSVSVQENRVRVWLNGEELGSVCVEVAESGPLGLHIESHPEEREAALVFSEVRLQRLARPPAQEETGGEPVSLFNGRDLSGWETSGDAQWTVEDGLLVGTQGEGNAPGDLFTTASYDDYDLTVTYRAEWPCNSGVWFRYQSASQSYQADILEYPDPECYAGSLYCTGKFFLALNKDRSIVDREGWNTLRVRAEGDHVRTWINGYAVADVRDDTSATGRIGFQIHAGTQFGPMKIVIREVLLRKL